MEVVARGRGLVRTFGSGRAALRVLDGVDVELAAGELVAVVGRSGSGKSTLLHLLGGLDRPDAGTIELDGVRVDQAGERELARLRREKIGFVFQAFHLLPELSGVENVLLPARITRNRAAMQRGRELVEQLGLGGAGERLPVVLSGGEQQRLAIARALINDPLLVLADEPTGNLDPESGATVVELLRQVAQQGKAVLVVTHEPSVVEPRRQDPATGARKAHVVGAVLAYAWARARAHRGRQVLALLGVVAAAAMVGASVTIAATLSGGFDRTAQRRDCPTSSRPSTPLPQAQVAHVVSQLANVRGASYVLQHAGVTRGSPTANYTDHGKLYRRQPRRARLCPRRAATTSTAPAQAVVEAGLARAWQLQASGEQYRSSVRRRPSSLRIVGIAVPPDIVAFPLTKGPRIYTGYDGRSADLKACRLAT